MRALRFDKCEVPGLFQCADDNGGLSTVRSTLFRQLKFSKPRDDNHSSKNFRAWGGMSKTRHCKRPKVSQANHRPNWIENMQLKRSFL